MIADLCQILHVAVTNFLQRILSEGTGVHQILIPGAIPWFNTLFYTFYNFLIMRRGDLCSIFPINLVKVEGNQDSLFAKTINLVNYFSYRIPATFCLVMQRSPHLTGLILKTFGTIQHEPLSSHLQL